MVSQELYTVMEVAAICRVHLSTVRRWIRHGHIQVVRLPGGGIRIPVCEVDRLREPVGATR